MEERINLNVSATNYDQASKEISTILTMLEEMVHEENVLITANGPIWLSSRADETLPII